MNIILITIGVILAAIAVMFCIAAGIKDERDDDGVALFFIGIVLLLASHALMVMV